MSHRKSEENIKSKTWSLRLTPSDDDRLRRVISDAGYLTIGQYVRNELLGGSRRKVPAKAAQPAPDQEIIRQLKKIGVNLNQSERTMNSIVKAGHLSAQSASIYIKEIRSHMQKIEQITSKLDS